MLYIMEYRITISPDPTRIVNQAQRRNYMSCTSREQYNIIKHNIRAAMADTFLEYDLSISLKLYVYFEFNSSGLLHCHGTLTTDTNKDISMFFQRMIFRNLGRVFINKNIKTYMDACCDIVDAKIKPWKEVNISDRSGYSTWLMYCLKDQDEGHKKKYPPFEYNLTTEEKLLQEERSKEIAKQLDAIKKIKKKLDELEL